jgi:glycosyltransferase involved in cell wall biosynthesis
VKKWYDQELAGPVYAGVDTERFAPLSVTDPNRILYVGRLGDGKGVGRLLKAARQLNRNYTVRIVGDGPLRDELETNAPQCVEFAGTVDHDRIHHEYQQAAVTVLPTVHEAFPVTVIESLACGTPVVATDIDATRLTIDHTNTGYLLSDRNPETICDGITQVLSHERYRTAARTDGRATAHNYDWASQADAFRSLLANVGDYPDDC